MDMRYRDVLMGNVSKEDVQNIKCSLLEKKKKALTRFLLYAAVFIISVISVILLKTYGLLDAYGLIGVMCGFFSFGGIAVTLFKLYESLEFLRALKRCRPASRITSCEYWKYDFRKIDESLIKRIAAHKFTVDEAGGIRNLAVDNSASGIKAAFFFMILAVLCTVIAYFTPPRIMTIEVVNKDFILMLLYAPRVVAMLLVFLALRQLVFTRTAKKYVQAVNNSYTKEYALERTTQVDELISGLREKSAAPSIRLAAKREAVDVFSSKFGGKPYLPPGFDYPSKNSRPLCLLAQLNFELLPKLPDFPETGILQFYLSNNDKYIFSHNPLMEKDDFRVVYHEEILRDESKLKTPPPVTEYESRMLPFSGEFKLYAELEQSFISSNDFRFAEQALSLYNNSMPAQETRLSDLPSDLFFLGAGLSNSEEHRIGGYPAFAQRDPREADARYDKHIVLLLQIDSDRENEISWGDSGIGNFFITPEDLKAKDFSDVLCAVDCY